MNVVNIYSSKHFKIIYHFKCTALITILFFNYRPLNINITLDILIRICIQVYTIGNIFCHVMNLI